MSTKIEGISCVANLVHKKAGKRVLVTGCSGIFSGITEFPGDPESYRRVTTTKRNERLRMQGLAAYRFPVYLSSVAGQQHRRRRNLFHQ